MEASVASQASLGLATVLRTSLEISAHSPSARSIPIGNKKKLSWVFFGVSDQTAAKAQEADAQAAVVRDPFPERTK
jgi:hypothetical protein